MTYREAVIEGMKRSGAPPQAIEYGIREADVNIGPPDTRQLAEAEAESVIASTILTFQLAFEMTTAQRDAVARSLDWQAIKNHAKN